MFPLLCMVLLAACGQPATQQQEQVDLVNKQGDLGNGTYINPIMGGDYPDPTIMRDGEDYYMTHSSFDYLPGLTVFHSKDLVNWEPISYGLKTYLGSVWAPDITKYKDKYYIYFTVAGAGRERMNFVIYADSPYGPWSDPIDLKIGNIDPCHIVGEDGTQWMFLSHGKRVKLTDDGLAIVPGTEEVVYEGWQYPEEWETEGLCLEGPKLRKIGDYYYYLNAEGGTAGPPTSHMVVVARSKSIDGPWENSPYNPIIHTYDKADRWWSKGHGSLIDTPDGNWYIVYHAYENGYTGLGRQTLMEPVEMTEDGWFKAKEGVDIEKPIVKPIASDNVIDRKAHLYEFRPGLDWRFYKEFDTTRIGLKDGVLTMKAKGTTPGTSSPMMFIAGAQSYEFEVEIEKDPETLAGLLIYYNSDFFVGTGFDSANRFRYRKGAISKTGQPHDGKNHLWLKLRNDKQVITGAYSYDGKNWIRETWGMEVSGYNHNTLYEFQSMLPAVFAAGEGEVRFKNFKYTQL